MQNLVIALAAAATSGMLMSTAASAADDVPRRKSGQWEIAVTTAGQPSANVSTVCIDRAADDLARSAGTAVAQSECEQASISREGDRYRVRSVCALRSSTLTTDAVLEGDFDRAYTAQIESNYSPPLYGRSQVKSSVQARFLGPCS